jgi:Coenzyme PQQ synthesis protein D (PqqD)
MPSLREKKVNFVSEDQEQAITNPIPPLQADCFVRRSAVSKLGGGVPYFGERLMHGMPDKYIARNSPVAARTPGGEMLVMLVVDSTFFTLSEVGAAIWQAADGKTPLSQIVSKRICPEFDVDMISARRDAERFVDELSGHGILLVSEQPIDSSIPSEAA